MIEKLHPELNNDREIYEMFVEDKNNSTTNSDIDLWSLHKSLEQKHSNKTKSGSRARDEIRSYLDKGVVHFGQKVSVYITTSMPSEQLFCKTGNIMTKSQNRLLGSRL